MKRPSLLSERELEQAGPAPVSREEAWLPVTLLAAPVTWALHLAIGYGLVYPAERWQSKVTLGLTTGAAVLGTLTSSVLGWRGLRSLRRVGPRDAVQRERSRFLCQMACVLGVFFFLATLAQAVPVLMLPLGGR